MKDPETRTPGQARRSARKGHADAEARTLARIRTAAVIVRHRQESLYDRLADRFRLAFEAGAGRGREAMDVAAEKAREQLTAAGALTKSQGERLKRLLLRDLDRAAAELHAAGASAAEHLNPARLEAGALSSIAIVLDSAAGSLHDFARRADEALACRTGEVTTAGTLTCDKCRAALHFRSTGTVPPCPTCLSTSFRKGY